MVPVCPKPPPGTVDSDYRGEIGAIVINLSNEPYTITDGERICQMVITRHSRVEWEPAKELDETTLAFADSRYT